MTLAAKFQILQLTHIAKGSTALHMNIGCTVLGPYAAAACIRGAPSMGSIWDIYVLQEKAGNQH
jgi:hypothetical protein